METFWLFWLRFGRAYDSAYESDFWFPLGHKRSYNFAYDSDSDSVASENQPLKTFRKIFHIKHIAIPMTRGCYKRLTWPEGFGAFMVNRCAVLWCRRDFELRLHTVTLPCFALCRKTTPNKQRPAQRIKWPWIEPRLHRKSNNRPKFPWEQFISIFMPTLLVNNNIEFLIQSL